MLPETIVELNEMQFCGCSALEYVEIKGAVQIIGPDTFSDCTSLVEVILPDTVETIDEYAFYGCTSLESIFIPESVTSMYATSFEECTLLNTIEGVKGSFAETFANNNGYTFVEK